jgi:hypothetical protein
MRGAGATCTAPPTHGRPKRMKVPEYGKIGAGIAVVAFPSERRLSPRSDLSLGGSRADRRDWLATCDIIHRHSRHARRRRVPRAGWLAGPGIPPGERRWDSEASSEAAGRRERTALMSGYGTVGPSSWHALGGPHHGLGSGGCCEMGEPAGVLFDTAACNDQHEYDDRSVRETDRGSYRAASVQSPPTSNA